jgi:hypothetical protein
MLELPIPTFFRVDTGFTVYRKTDFIMDAGGIGDVAVDRQPSSPSKLMVTVAGTTAADQPMSFAFTGLDSDDAAIADTLDFTDNGFKLTSNSYKTISTITPTVPGTYTDAGVSISIKSRDRGNEPIFNRVAEITNFKPSFQPTTNLIDKLRFPDSGTEEEAHAEIYFNRVEFTPVIRDIFSSPDLGDWEIINVATWLQSHYRLRAKKL